MRRSELAAIKRCPKRLRDVSFKRLRKRDLPKPLDKIGGPRLSHSGLIDVDDSSCVAFIARDGDAPERRLFLGHFFRRTPQGLLPLAILHYHPSHKGVHVLLNCETTLDYTERQLPGASELTLTTPDAELIDPGTDVGRNRLVIMFCERCGIRVEPDDKNESLPL